jgi:hypothetical protein
MNWQGYICKIKDIMTDLDIIKAHAKVSSKNQEHTHQHKKQLKNPCRIHNGGHRRDDC